MVEFADSGGDPGSRLGEYGWEWSLPEDGDGSFLTIIVGDFSASNGGDGWLSMGEALGEPYLLLSLLSNTSSSAMRLFRFRLPPGLRGDVE